MEKTNHKFSSKVRQAIISNMTTMKQKICIFHGSKTFIKAWI